MYMCSLVESTFHPSMHRSHIWPVYWVLIIIGIMCIRIGNDVKMSVIFDLGLSCFFLVSSNR